MILKSKLYTALAILVSVGLVGQIFVVPASLLSQGVQEVKGTKIDLSQSNEISDLDQAIMAPGSASPEYLPDGFLIDSAALEAKPLPAEADALANPLSLSRVQSQYQAGGTVVITYTVSNNRPPSLFPDIAENATITETAQILAAFDQVKDPNSIRDVTVSNSFNGAGSFLAASPFPDRQGDSFVWNLGDIPPQSERSFILEMQLPGTAPDFLNLDSGAFAHGSLQGRMVSAQAAAAILAPDGFAQWLIWTPDANIYDGTMLSQTANLAQDPALLFNAVRSFGYEAYTGSLRGTRGTLWSEAGNSLDQSSLLIAMLRAGGIPARYRHGSLSVADAQELILSMFPTPKQVVGYLPDDIAVSDPVNDPALIAEVQDHWWVEAYLPGTGWTNLDPSFADAAAGDIFATPSGDAADQIAELPDNVRHKVHLSLKVEKYNSFPMSGSNLSVTTPLTATLNTVELVGRPINVSFLVNSKSQGGLTYSNIIHTYTPILSTGAESTAIVGQSFSDLLTNFPLATNFATGIWLMVETETPEGEVAAYEREIKDRIGVENRENGGYIELEPLGDNSPAISSADVIQVQVVPQSFMPRQEINRALQDVLAVSSNMGNAHASFASLDVDDPAASLAWIDENADELQAAQLSMLDMLGTTFYALATAPDRQSASAAMLVKSYPDKPKLLLMSQTAITETINFSFELLNIEEKSIAYPGQNEEATISANLTRTTGDKSIEYELLSMFTADQTQSAYETMQMAQENDIPLLFVTASNLADLALLTISDEAKARITGAVREGAAVFVPTEAVNIDGEMEIGWLEIDEAGNGHFVNEVGQRASYAEYQLKLYSMLYTTGPGSSLLGGFIVTVVSFIGNIIGAANSLLEAASGGAVDGMLARGGGKIGLDMWLALTNATADSLEACNKAGPYKPACAGGVAIAALLIGSMLAGIIVNSDPSLPDMLVSRITSSGGEQEAAAAVTVPASSSANSLSISAETDHATLVGSTDLTWSDSNEHGFVVSSLTANNVSLYVNGILVESGSLEANGLTPASLASDGITIQLNADGSHSYYAPAVTGLGVGTEWESYTADLSSSQPYTITLASATATMNGSSSYAGGLTAVISGSAQVSGPEHGPTPQFSSSATVQMQPSSVNTGPLAGTILADGLPFPAENGIAAAPLNGSFVVSEVSGTADLVEFSGPADFFALSLSPTNSTVNPTQPVIITPNIAANFTDTYTMTAAAPVGWTTEISSEGVIRATAPTGAAPADYLLLVTAQSQQYPDLFVSAVHSATVLAHEGVALSIIEDPLVTMPMGPVADPLAVNPGPLGHVVNGQAEIPGAAYTINITNTATVSHTFDISVGGLPSDWVLLSKGGQTTATSLFLEAGEIGQIGLYISPTLTSLLAPGTNYTIDVTSTAQNNPSVNDNDSILFTMPGLAFPYPRLEPEHQFVTQGDPISFEFSAANRGNSAGSLPITAAVKASPFSEALLLPTPITSAESWTTPFLAPGATDDQTITITTTGMSTGQTYFVQAASTQAEFEPTAYAAFTVASATSGPVFEASTQMADSCTAGEPGLSDSLAALALAMNDVEQSCDAGSCSLPARNQAVSAVGGVEYYAGEVSDQIAAISALHAIASAMSGHSSSPDLLADLDAITLAVADLEDEVCEWSRYQADVTWTPTFGAMLAGDTLTYTLDIENSGTVTTSYAVTISLPSAASTINIELPPGGKVTNSYPVTETTLGLYQLRAEAVVNGISADIRSSDVAQYNVVDKFVQITGVTADPPFVESGTSATNLSLDVTNVADLAQPATARTSILTSGGGISYTADIPLTILAGSPINYDLTSVDTSGWASGVYSITVELLDESDTLIPDGSGFGNFVVGQGLGVTHGAQPRIVAPGTVTVTTVITSELLGPTIPLTPLAAEPAAEWQTTGLRQAPTGSDEAANDQQGVDGPSPARSEKDSTPESDIAEMPAESTLNAPSITLGSQIVRYEEDEAGINTSGSWGSVSDSAASSGSYLRSKTAGNTASFDFNGTWVGLGFMGTTNGGQAEVTIDGVSQGIIDLYRWDKQAVAFYYDEPISATHTISVTVLGTSNANSSDSYVGLDFIDTWDGTSLPDGTFEAEVGNSSRVFLSSGWGDISNAAASDGAYVRDNSATAWFPFSGDSVSYQALAYASGGKVKVSIDGTLQTIFDLYNAAAITRTLSFDNLGAGPHVMQVSSYRGIAAVDTFSTPGSAPFFSAPTAAGVIRYEEDAPEIVYNGTPYTQTTSTWSEQTSSYASGGYYFRSDTPGDVAQLTFNNSWVGVGFIGGPNSGIAEIFIDGVSKGLVDNYRRDTQAVSIYYDGLISATHTISVTVTGSQHAHASGDRVNIDFIDAWDGTAVANGTFEAEIGSDERLFLSSGWNNVNNAAASDGAYVRASSASAWFPFSGDSVSYQAFAYASGGKAKVTIDGHLQTVLDLYNATAISRTLSFDNLGSGPHVMQISSYRGMSSVDTFSTPGSAPFFTPSAPTGIVRYEEDAPQIMYNGTPYTQTTSSWGAQKMSRASRGYVIGSNSLNDVISLTFDGSWVSLGFTTGTGSGQAQIMMDGVVIENIDTYSPTADVKSVFYGGLITGTHTISVTVLDQSHPASSNTTINLDYIDIWDGTSMAAGWYEADPLYQDNDRVDMSTDWRIQSDSGAREGLYYDNGSNSWFRFTGDDVTLLAFTDTNINSSAEIFIDGVSQGAADLTYDFTNSPIPLHFTGLGSGPHVVRMKGLDRAAIDAFEANPTTFHAGVPMVEWYDTAPAGGDGVISTAAAGDVNGDGQVELAISSDDGNLYLFAGDGYDAGSGTALIWSQVVGSEPDAPVLVELDGIPGTEIVVGSKAGIYAFHNDGSQYWFTDTIKTAFPAGGASAGNLDNDTEPEIVVAAKDSLAVLEANGTVAWEFVMNGQASPPLLADLTGDGHLDILILAENNHTAYLLDYDQGGNPAVEWSHVFTSTLTGLRGAPAVADIDGQQVGGDPGPEVIIATNGFINVLDADGTPLWKTAIGSGVPGGISIADTDGDGEVEIITSAQYDGGRIYVLNADGSILWTGPALDNTSGTSAVTHDLDGNGSWEVIWNGDGQGLTIYDGSDGTIIFNEPTINSITRKDFPIVADVDGDNHAEIVAGDSAGIYVVGYDAFWDESRDLWNQYNYHVTNINDDLTSPPAEPNSWQIHNSYRTQTPLNEVLSVYTVDITHTVGISGVQVLTNTLPSPVDIAAPQYHWAYTQYWYQPTNTSTFDVQVTNLQPGEVRQISQGTTVDYASVRGSNQLTLPPLFITADHIIKVMPASQSIGSGGTAVYDIILSNPADSADNYALSQVGLPPGWVTLPPTVTMAAGEQLTVSLSIDVPTTAAASSLDFAITARNDDGVTDMSSGKLEIMQLLEMDIQPKISSSIHTPTETFTMTLSNADSVTHTYTLTAAGLATVTLPLTITVPAADQAGDGVVVLPFPVFGSANGPNPFTVTASDDTAAASDSAVLNVSDRNLIGLTLDPAIKRGGPGTPTVYTVTVTNLGSVTDIYDLELSLPVGWDYSLNANGTATNSINLTAGLFNSADLQLMITPPLGTTPGDYDFGIMAQSQGNPGVTSSISGTVQVQDRGVGIQISPSHSILEPTGSGSWQVTITNTGSVGDSYWLTAAGIILLSSQFSSNPVALNPGQSTTVQLTTDLFDFGLPASYPFAVGVESENDSLIRNEAVANITFNQHEDVEIAWIPVTQTITDTLSATFLMVITNTGNVATTYDIGLNAPNLTAQMSLAEAAILPQMGFAVLVTVEADGPGLYTIEGTAASNSSSASSSAVATLEIIFSSEPPTVEAGNNQTVDEGETVNFSGTADDPESGPLDLLWDFGDGATAKDTLTPNHTYADNGSYLVTLVVTDVTGLIANDTLTVKVKNVAPMVEAGPNQHVTADTNVSLGPATFTDLGSNDTHSSTVNWGDGTIVPGVVNQAAGTIGSTHIYTAAGTYTVTVTVTDDDSGQSSDSFSAFVTKADRTIYLPIVFSKK